ncbi:MAG: NAD(P) transhydrogenase subunit alpha [Planctomycetota bacterium]
MENLPSHLLVFVLAAFLGLEVIRRVSPLLHTPLMSLTNAISAISVVAAIEIAGKGYAGYATALGTLALACSFANIVGGFLITDRMLRMFKRRGGVHRPGAKDTEKNSPTGGESSGAR